MKIPAMLSVEDALERILRYTPVLEAEERALLECLGRVLAEDVRAEVDIPPLPDSAMDGYAVRAQDIRDASLTAPRTLRVIGEAPAGRVFPGEVRPGTAVRIMTGAPVPRGADTVVPFEETDEMNRRRSPGAGGDVAIRKAFSAGAHIRNAGEDVRKGTTVMEAGAVLRPAAIGVLASVGRATARVVRRPVVAVLATGDELMEPGLRLEAGQIYNSNSYSVASAVLRYGGIPKVLGIARDNLPDLEAKIAKGLEADMLITSAGVSHGDYDIVKDVLAQKGEVAFWTVRMRPAKPLAFGALVQRLPGGRERRVPHLGLPGNPVSALVAFEIFARAAILKMQGRKKLDKPSIEAILEEPITNSDGRRVYARCAVTRRGGRYYARLSGSQGSNILTTMARANGLAICPEDVAQLNAGQTARVLMLDWDEYQALDEQD
ncbi:MAG: molybdopterin molybdotransferase MoeA [Dehalococcoidia bacterium]|nr:molybdopterin molybdotransferase MoeA [Dehalococcoidia bacterium]